MGFLVRAVDKIFRLEALADEAGLHVDHGHDHGVDGPGSDRRLEVLEAEIARHRHRLSVSDGHPDERERLAVPHRPSAGLGVRPPPRMPKRHRIYRIIRMMFHAQLLKSKIKTESNCPPGQLLGSDRAIESTLVLAGSRKVPGNRCVNARSPWVIIIETSRPAFGPDDPSRGRILIFFPMARPIRLASPSA